MSSSNTPDESPNVRLVRIAWVDYVGLTRYRVVSTQYLTKLAGSQFISTNTSSLSENLSEIGLPIVKNVFALQANDEITTGVDVLGSYQLRPDLSTLRSVSFAEGQAYVMGRFFCGMDGRGGESDLCPRTILQRVVEKAEKDLGVRFMVQFVTSFLLMEQGGAPASTGAWATSRKLGCNAVGRCIHEVAGNILDAGIELETYCDEGVDGQYEITTGLMAPMQAADALVLTREVIYNTAQKHNFEAALYPFTNPNQAGTASRIHLSVHSPRSHTPSNHIDIPDLPEDVASFIAGLLSNLISVCTFTLPADSSYTYTARGVWDGKAWACWSKQNTETPVKLCGSKQTRFTIELKVFDGLANPYLGLAAILAAGLCGLRARENLHMRECKVPMAQLTGDMRRELRIVSKMPTQNPVFEMELSRELEFITSWMPVDAWRLYKAVRHFERQISVPEYTPMGNPIQRTPEITQAYSNGYSRKYY